MVMSPVELGIKNDSAGEDQQQFIRPTDRPTYTLWWRHNVPPKVWQHRSQPFGITTPEHNINGCYYRVLIYFTKSIQLHTLNSFRIIGESWEWWIERETEKEVVISFSKILVTFTMREKWGMHKKISPEKIEERDHSEELCINWRIILRWILK
jgi:hypothetical protein